MDAREEPLPVTASLVSLVTMALLVGAALRIVLLAGTSPAANDPSSRMGEALLVGLRLDLVVACYLAAPLVLLLPSSQRAARRVAAGYGTTLVGVLAIAAPLELWFFQYYGFRPNYLLLEHGGDVEIWRAICRRYLSASNLVVIAASGGAALLLRAGIARIVAAMSSIPNEVERAASPIALLVMAVVVAIGARGTFDHRPLNPSAASISSNRALNEIAGSGWLNVAYEAARRRQRDSVRLSEVQRLLAPAEAEQRAQQLACDAGRIVPTDVDCRRRDVRTAGRTEEGLRNVVVVVMESFTARLSGTLGGELGLSPEFDVLAREGLLLTRCYATGERTVQGLEAILSSFPPLPGVSIVRRPEAQSGFSTLASVLGARGYDSLFLYGGQGIFDQMRSFFLGNGFRRFLDERDFEQPSFRGSWGVSDEDLFHRANRELQARWEEGTPFVAAILTVSLHSPWEFPKGRIPALAPDVAVPEGFEHAELENFLYADFAVGEFVREARTLPFFRDTLFVFVGDHGVHLRGRALVPSEEYRVPALFYAPDHLGPARIEEITSQIDIAPTILGLLGVPVPISFFGRDVRETPARGGLAPLIYAKKHYAARRENRLTVLMEGGARRAYWVHRSGVFETEPTPAHVEDSLDVLALAQVAEGRLDREVHRTVARLGQDAERGASASDPATRTPR